MGMNGFFTTSQQLKEHEVTMTQANALAYVGEEERHKS